MTYKIFYTDGPLPPNQLEPDLSRLMPFERETRDVALETACQLLARGALVWCIEGTDGSQMTRTEVERECELRRWKKNLR